MFSSRFHWSFEPNRLASLRAEVQRSGEPFLDLTESNPTHAGLDYPPEIFEALGDRASLDYAPDPAGHPAARAAVAGYYAARGHRVDPAQILLTASTSEAYAYLFKLLADPGDQVLVPRPSYPLFEFLATMESVQVAQYPLDYHGAWHLDVDALRALLTPRTRVIVLVNPNNPTGSYIKRHELEAIETLALDRGLALISDEVFADYAFGTDPGLIKTLVGRETALSFSMSGLSKIAGLPQMKLGWIVVNGPAALARQAFERLEWVADTYLSVSTPVQHAAPRLLGYGQQVQAQIRERTASNLAFARAAVSGTAASLLDVEGGWCAIVQVPRTRTEEEWSLGLLEHARVLVQPGYFYNFETEAFLILSLLAETRVFREGITRVLDYIRD